jgi:hypothetical protein
MADNNDVLARLSGRGLEFTSNLAPELRHQLRLAFSRDVPGNPAAQSGVAVQPLLPGRPLHPMEGSNKAWFDVAVIHGEQPQVLFRKVGGSDFALLERQGVRYISRDEAKAGFSAKSLEDGQSQETELRRHLTTHARERSFGEDQLHLQTLATSKLRLAKQQGSEPLLDAQHWMVANPASQRAALYVPLQSSTLIQLYDVTTQVCRFGQDEAARPSQVLRWQQITDRLPYRTRPGKTEL